jgi:hypothetical protein
MLNVECECSHTLQISQNGDEWKNVNVGQWTISRLATEWMNVECECHFDIHIHHIHIQLKKKRPPLSLPVVVRTKLVGLD